MSKMTICLWFDNGNAREAAEFYASVFPDSQVGKAHASAVDIPMEAMMTMRKIDIATIEAARRGEG